MKLHLFKKSREMCQLIYFKNGDVLDVSDDTIRYGAHYVTVIESEHKYTSFPVTSIVSIVRETRSKKGKLELK